MRIAGKRQRTIESYQYIIGLFKAINKLVYLEDITVETLYHYLYVLKVTPATTLIRLKSTKAALSKFYNNGWIIEKFWCNISFNYTKHNRVQHLSPG
ncbi:hypothetical protein MHB40_20210 [Lysinibacillus sp. FSL K6-0057]|uniref:hypothetical protein n=1 Tax=Lysinibacillus sp. FSL K6-0057 TaxID=2921411 RepID=UPI00315A61F5